MPPLHYSYLLPSKVGVFRLRSAKERSTSCEEVSLRNGLKRFIRRVYCTFAPRSVRRLTASAPCGKPTGRRRRADDGGILFHYFLKYKYVFRFS